MSDVEYTGVPHYGKGVGMYLGHVDGVPEYKEIIWRRTNRLLTTRETLNLEVDLSTMSLHDLHELIFAVMAVQIEEQESIGNFVSRFEINRREGYFPDGRPIRHVDAQFGAGIAPELMRVIEQEVGNQIDKYTSMNHPVRAARWTWYYLPYGGRRQQVHTPPTMGFKDRLIMIPQSPDMGIADMEVAKYGFARWKNGEFLKNKVYVGDGEGFMGKAAQKVKGNNAFRTFTIYAAFTKKYAWGGEKYSHGSPFITILAKRKGYSPKAKRIQNKMSAIRKTKKGKWKG